MKISEIEKERERRTASWLDTDTGRLTYGGISTVCWPVSYFGRTVPSQIGNLQSSHKQTSSADRLQGRRRKTGWFKFFFVILWRSTCSSLREGGSFNIPTGGGTFLWRRAFLDFFLLFSGFNAMRSFSQRHLLQDIWLAIFLITFFPPLFVLHKSATKLSSRWTADVHFFFRLPAPDSRLDIITIIL